MKTLYLTVSDRTFFPGTVAAVNSILRHQAEGEIAVISSGEHNQALTPRQIEFLSRPRVRVYSHEDFRKGSRTLGAWQLKAHGAADLSVDYDLLVGFDSDLVFCGPVDDVISQTAKDGKWRGGADGDGIKYDTTYSTYGFDAPAKNPKYMSTSCYFCLLTDENRELLKQWSLKSDKACYGPQEEKLYPGHGDQGVLNALLFAHGLTDEVELLPNQLWSQHWTYEHDVISPESQRLTNLSADGAPMRTIHCGGSDKFWHKAHSSALETESGSNRRWSYALFLRELFLGETSSWTSDPFEVIPQEFGHLFSDLINYSQSVRNLTQDFSEAWSKISPAWINRCLEESGVERLMTLCRDGKGPMNRYIELGRFVPRFGKVVEVGSYKGGSILSLAIALLDRDLTFYSVESFLGNGDGKVDDRPLPGASVYVKNLKHQFPFLPLHLIQLPSSEAAKLFEDASLDLVFIDANHSEPSVREDIEHWKPKLRSTGTLAGDDIQWEGVRRAVSDTMPDAIYSCDIWFKNHVRTRSNGSSYQPRIATVRGERCSGTKWLTYLLKNNIPELSVRNNDDHFRWKHGFMTTREVSRVNDETVLLIIFKQILPWLDSIRRRPYHMPHLRNLSLTEFLDLEYYSVADDAKFLRWYGIEEKEEIPERTDGLRFRNIVEMRSSKHWNWLRAASSVSNAFVIDYEVLLNNPEQVIGSLCSKFGLSQSPVFDRGKPFPRARHYSEKAYLKAFDQEHVDTIQRLSDPLLEKTLELHASHDAMLGSITRGSNGSSRTSAHQPYTLQALSPSPHAAAIDSSPPGREP